MAAPVLVMASRNQGKLRELRQILQDLDLSLLGLDDFPGLPEIPEAGASFAANAAPKRRRCRGSPPPGPGGRTRGWRSRPYLVGPESFRLAMPGPHRAVGAQRRRQLAQTPGGVARKYPGAPPGRFVCAIARLCRTAPPV